MVTRAGASQGSTASRRGCRRSVQRGWIDVCVRACVSVCVVCVGSMPCHHVPVRLWFVGLSVSRVAVRLCGVGIYLSKEEVAGTCLVFAHRCRSVLLSAAPTLTAVNETGGESAAASTRIMAI